MRSRDEEGKWAIVTHQLSSFDSMMTQEQLGCHSVALDKTFGETGVVGTADLERPPWHWPAR